MHVARRFPAVVYAQKWYADLYTITQRKELTTLEAKRQEDVTTAKKKATDGYVFTDKRGQQHTVVALHEYNAEDVLNYYDTARKRAMKDKTILPFHRFKGEGRLYQSIHSDR